MGADAGRGLPTKAMKKRTLVKHLRRQGCERRRQGRRHEWWINVETGDRSAVPRHNEISDALAKKICRDLGVDPPQRE